MSGRADIRGGDPLKGSVWSHLFLSHRATRGAASQQNEASIFRWTVTRTETAFGLGE